MPPAARATDRTDHGTPLVGGSTDVLVGGRPAWRAQQDVHVCPLASGNVPHVGGPVQSGSRTVFVNGTAAVRRDDVIVENGVTNTVASGEKSVQIG